ncbi:efflux RND transporter periplasmic adaptor subunit [Pararhodospirillum photometricum]|nr:efflux RND transporter periplasmic adaptor subunit [Pararhodospirillum photometricum]
MSFKRMAIMVVGATVLFGGVIGFTQFKQKMIEDYFAHMPRPLVTVTAETATQEHWSVSVPAVATLRAVNGVDVSPSVAGQITALRFQSGQMVRQGEPLVQLDIDEEQSLLASARASASLARITAARASSLVRTSAGTRASLDDAEAQVRITEAKINEIEAQIAKKTIRAPFSGQLGVRLVDLGEYVAAGQALVNLQDLSVILADFSVSQRDLSLLQPGAPLTLTSDAWPDRTFEGSVTAVAPQINAKTGMVSVEGRFPNPDGTLRPGMLARVKVMQPVQENVLTVPVSAVTYALSGDAVFVLRPAPAADADTKPDAKSDTPKADTPKPDAQAERVRITLGERRGDRVVVKEGLSDTDRVVTSGQMKLENGSLVLVSPHPLSAAQAR